MSIYYVFVTVLSSIMNTKMDKVQSMTSSHLQTIWRGHNVTEVEIKHYGSPSRDRFLMGFKKGTTETGSLK